MNSIRLSVQIFFLFICQQISSNKDAELTLPQQGLVAYYKFNQGTANGDNTSETTLEDALDTNDGTK